jgi:hypothetical protein
MPEQSFAKSGMQMVLDHPTIVIFEIEIAIASYIETALG